MSPAIATRTVYNFVIEYSHFLIARLTDGEKSWPR